MRKLAIIMAMALVLCGAFAMSAQATGTFDFDIFAATGKIAYDTAGGPLVGTAITVRSVLGPDNVIYPITNGTLDFRTGDFSGSDPAHWNFGPGGFILLDGTIVKDGKTLEIDKEGELVSGFVVNSIAGADTFHTFVGRFSDTLGVGFLKAFGFTGDEEFNGNINLSFNTDLALAPGQDVTFTTTLIGSGDVSQTLVPVPPSMILLGSGLLGLVGLRFRKNQA